MKLELEDDYHINDDDNLIREGINKNGHYFFYIRKTIQSESKKKEKLIRQLQKTSKAIMKPLAKTLPKEKLEAIRLLAKKNKEECRAALTSSIESLDLKHWRALKKDCDTSDCAIIKFLESNRKNCNGFLRSHRELRYVTPDLEIVYMPKKNSSDNDKSSVLNEKVKRVLKEQVERFLCDERVRKDGSL